MFLYNYMDLEIAHKIDKKPVMQPDYTKHYHDFYEIYFFVRGNVLYTVEEEKKIFEKCDLVFIQPGQHHFVTFLDYTSIYERYVIKFQEHHLLPEFIEKNLSKRSAFFGINEKYTACFEKLDNLYNNYNTLELQLLFSNVITELLIELNRSKANEKTIKIDNKVNMIIKFINENLRQPLTVQDLCEKFHFSQSHLYREFYTHMKIPLMKYIRSKKILEPIN